MDNKIYFSLPELAERWCTSQTSVYRFLRLNGAEVLDFAVKGRAGKKLVRLDTVLQLERKRTKRIA